jgi:hypothetical protein
MKLTLEADPDGCGYDKPCPKVWSTDDGRLFIQGKRADTAVLAQINRPDDEVVAEFPRQALLDWAARQFARRGDG